jgi:HAD superfamily hydrolase (TIGR01549 family)
VDTKIKAVFFDYDGVLTIDKTGSLTTCKYLSFITGIKFEVVIKAYKSFNKELTLGVKSHADIWNEFCGILNVKIEEKHLIEAFKSTPLNTKMIEFATMLKNKGLSLGIITDNKKDRISYLRKFQNLDDIFDSIVVSSELGFDKHSREIFLTALENLNLTPQMCVFIDNQESNLVIPREIGMKTILHDDLVNDVELIKIQLDSFETM